MKKIILILGFMVIYNNSYAFIGGIEGGGGGAGMRLERLFQPSLDFTSFENSNLLSDYQKLNSNKIFGARNNQMRSKTLTIFDLKSMKNGIKGKLIGTLP